MTDVMLLLLNLDRVCIIQEKLFKIPLLVALQNP